MRGDGSRVVIELNGKVTIVTGGASGIGAASCRALAAAGRADRGRRSRPPTAAQAVAAEVDGIAVAADVSDEVAVNAMVAEVTSRLGPIDICFSNAGVATGGDILTTEPEVWNEQWAINVMAHVYAVRAVLPGMLERGSGYLVHTASMAGILTSHGNVTYATTKHAVVGLAEWLSITYHHRGIRVSLIAPLGVRTPMLERRRSAVCRRGGRSDQGAGGRRGTRWSTRFARSASWSSPIRSRETWMQRKTDDPERWLRGMRRVQQQLEEGDGTAQVSSCRAGLQNDVDVVGVPASARFPDGAASIARIVQRERAHQRRLDAEDDVGFEVPALRVEHVRRHRDVPVRGHDEVDVRRAPRVPSRCLQHPADRTVVGNRVVHRSDRAKRERAVAVGPKPAAQVLRRPAPRPAPHRVGWSRSARRRRSRRAERAA